MKSGALSRELCKAYCQYYKPSKAEDLACMGFIIVERLIARGLMVPFWACTGPSADTGEIRMPAHETAMMLISQVCTVCPFSGDDCDFTDAHRRGAADTLQVSAIPCGGFLFLGRLIETRVVDIKDIAQVVEAYLTC